MLARMGGLGVFLANLKSYFDSFQPWTPTTEGAWQAEYGGAGHILQVGDGKTYNGGTGLADAIAAMGAGDLIECYPSTAGDYDDQGVCNFHVGGGGIRGVNQLVEITGSTSIVGAYNGATIWLQGIFSHTINAGVSPFIAGRSQTIKAWRCMFLDVSSPANSRLNAINNPYGKVEVYSCVFATYGECVKARDEIIAQGCTFHNLHPTPTTNFAVLSQNKSVQAYNCGFGGFINGGTAYDISAGTTYDVDYCITTNAALPGTGTHNTVAVTWGTYYDANYSPLHETSKHGGDPTHSFTLDYYGNILPDGSGYVPIGGIYAG